MAQGHQVLSNLSSCCKLGWRPAKLHGTGQLKCGLEVVFPTFVVPLGLSKSAVWSLNLKHQMASEAKLITLRSWGPVRTETLEVSLWFWCFFYPCVAISHKIITPKILFQFCTVFFCILLSFPIFARGNEMKICFLQITRLEYLIL